MALHTSLPIYKAAYSLLDVATDYAQNMPRSVRVAIGGRLSELLRGPLVLASFRGDKTQTRRTRGLEEINADPDAWQLGTVGRLDCEGHRHHGKFGAHFIRKEFNTSIFVPCPYGGQRDLIWVREAWYCDHGKAPISEKEKRKWASSGQLLYKADGDIAWGPDCSGSLWKPSIHMPRWSSRLTLELQEVRIERVQDISEEDAIAEGVDAVSMGSAPRQATWNRRQDFAQLWDRINAKRGYDWESNPSVWVLVFKAHKINVDRFLEERSKNES
jgi:hypothetical protein